MTDRAPLGARRIRSIGANENYAVDPSTDTQLDSSFIDHSYQVHSDRRNNFYSGTKPFDRSGESWNSICRWAKS